MTVEVDAARYCASCGECNQRGAHAYWCRNEPDRDPVVIAAARGTSVTPSAPTHADEGGAK